jgi:hypothetical protein
MSVRYASQNSGLSRRQFLVYSSIAAAGASAFTACATPRPRRLAATDKLRIACVGVGGKGRSDVAHCGSEEIVALCDADESQAVEARKSFPNAKFYADWREMLDEEEDNIDAITVSTPDHLHAVVASRAIKMGKHVYCQKPLTQTVHEARYLRKLASQYNVVTQMGNQGSAEDGLRRAVEVVQAGVIGPIRQIHVWTNRPIWPQGLRRPDGSDPVPQGLKWDHFLGPADPIPYKAGIYHPFNWRGWFDFGTGALGDMACHTANMPFRAAKLGYPKLIELLDHSELNPDTFPKTSKIRFLFPSREGLPETEFFWYDGNPSDKEVKPLRPHEDITTDIRAMLDNVPDAGCLLIGETGQVFSPDSYGAGFFIKMNDEKDLVISNSHEAVKAVPQTIPRNTHPGGSDERQHLEWIAGCKGGPEPYSNFNIAAYLTEIILLGCVALRTGKKLEWDGPGMKAANAPEAAQFIKRAYRKGYRLA